MVQLGGGLPVRGDDPDLKVPPARTKSPLGKESSSVADESNPGNFESLSIFPLLMNFKTWSMERTADDRNESSES